MSGNDASAESGQEDKQCEGCGRTDDFVGSLVVCRRRYEHVCPDCMDILEQVLDHQLVRDVDPEEVDDGE